MTKKKRSLKYQVFNFQVHISEIQGFKLDLQICRQGEGISPAGEGIAKALSVVLQDASGK